MANSGTTKLVVYAVVKTPDNESKVIAVYTRHNVEDSDHAKNIVESMQSHNRGFRMFGELTSRWHIS